MSILTPQAPLAPSIQTTSTTLEMVVAIIDPSAARINSSLIQSVLYVYNLIWHNTFALSDSQSPLTPQQIFTALGSNGGQFVTFYNALEQFINSLEPGTLPVAPATTTDSNGLVTVTGA